MSYQYNIDALNAIVTGLDGAGGHVSEISALTEWNNLLAGTAGTEEEFTSNISALNAIAAQYGAASNSIRDIDAYNAISVALSNAGGSVYIIDTLNQIIGDAGGGGPYTASAVHFDGNYLRNQNSIAGLPAGYKCLLIAGWMGNFSEGSFWEIDVLGPSNVAQILATTFGGGAHTATTVQIYASDAGDNTIFSLANEYDDVVDFETGWHSVAISADTQTQTLQFYIDRVAMDVSMVSWDSTNAIKPFGDAGGYGVGCAFYTSNQGGGPGSVDISDSMALLSDTFFDLSVSSNLDKLFSADNKPISWGADGSLVTGTQPQIFLTGDSATYLDNAGSIGPFVAHDFMQALGSNGPGAVSLAGAVIGRSVLSATRLDNQADVSADFENTISVTDQIQQTSADDYSAIGINFVLSEAAITDAASSPSD